MSPWKRKQQFPGHPPSVCINDLGIEVLCCDLCGCPVSHTIKSTVQGHLDSKRHAGAIETMNWAPCGLWKGYGAKAVLGLCCFLPRE